MITYGEGKGHKNTGDYRLKTEPKYTNAYDVWQAKLGILGFDFNFNRANQYYNLNNLIMIRDKQEANFLFGYTKNML